MRRHYIITSLIILMLLVSGCASTTNNQVSIPEVPGSSDIDIPGDVEKEEVFSGIFDMPDPDFNPYNTLIQEYKGDIYYTNYSGLYRMNPETGQSTTIITQSLIQYFVVHGDSVYYYDYEKESILRISANGEGEPFELNIEGIDKPLLLGKMCKIADMMFVYLNIFPDNGSYSSAVYAADLKGDPETLSFREVSGWPSPNGMRYYLKSTSAGELGTKRDIFVQEIDSEESMNVASDMNSDRYIVTNKYIFFLQYVSEDFSQAEVRRMNLDGSAVQTFINDSVTGNFYFAKYDDEYLYCIITDDSGSVRESLLRFDQETGESQEIQNANVDQFDVAGGFIYGYDQSVKDIVRVQLP